MFELYIEGVKDREYRSMDDLLDSVENEIREWEVRLAGEFLTYTEPTGVVWEIGDSIPFLLSESVLEGLKSKTKRWTVFEGNWNFEKDYGLYHVKDDVFEELKKLEKEGMEWSIVEDKTFAFIVGGYFLGKFMVIQVAEIYHFIGGDNLFEKIPVYSDVEYDPFGFYDSLEKSSFGFGVDGMLTFIPVTDVGDEDGSTIHVVDDEGNLVRFLKS